MYSQITPNGRVQFFERYLDPVTGLRKTVSVVLDRNTNVTRKAAKTVLDEKIRQKLAAPASSDFTLAQLIAKYTDSNIRDVRPSTMARDVRVCASLARILNPNSRIANYNARYILDRLAADDKKKMPERLVRLKALLRWAYINEYVYDIAYLDRLKPPREQKKDVKLKFLEADELHAILDALSVPAWKSIASFLAFTGLRIGEAQALRAEDLDGDVIHITKTYDRERDADGPTKTGDSTRDVIVLPQLRPILDEITPSDGFLLPDPRGGRFHYDSFRQYFGDVAFRVIGRRVTPHALRHTYTSLMAAAGVPLDVISRQLGHSDSRITRDVYLHVTERLKDRDRDILRSIQL